MLAAKRTLGDVVPRAQSALSQSPISELRDLRVERTSGGVTLSGSVSSFYHKQLAQEVVWAVCRDGGLELINHIRVGRPNPFLES